jgi:hypothetical protein
MPPTPQTVSLTAIAPEQGLSITRFLNMNIGPNIVVNNNLNGVDFGGLQLNTDSIISGMGLNVSQDVSTGLSKLTISKDGEINTLGAIKTSSSIHGDDDLTIGTNFSVTASTGHISAASLSVDGSVALNGSVVFTDTLDVAKAVNFAHTLGVAKAVTFADTLDVTKAATFADTLGVTKAATFADTLDVAKDLKVGGNNVVITADTGAVTSVIPYSSYTLNASSSNTEFTIHSTSVTNEVEFFGSSTNNLLTTQEYVDKQIWNQTKRLNTILGKDSNELDNFNKVYEVITKIAGDSDIVKTLTDTNDKYGTLVDKTDEIKTSMSDIVSFAHNDVLVRCSRSVWADQFPPAPIPSTVSYMGEGWYFRNFTQGQKINFYLPTSGMNMTVKDINQLVLNVFAVSDKALPYISVYTAPKNPATDIWGIAHARINYLFTSPTTSTSNTANKPYCLYTSDDAPINIYNTTPVKNSHISTVNKSNTNTYSLMQSIDSNIVSPEDKIVFMAIGSDSGYSANDLEFVLNSFNLCLNSGTTRFLFTNASVATNYLFNFNFNRHADFSSMNAKEIAYLAKYTEVCIPTPSA